MPVYNYVISASVLYWRCAFDIVQSILSLIPFLELWHYSVAETKTGLLSHLLNNLNKKSTHIRTVKYFNFNQRALVDLQIFGMPGQPSGVTLVDLKKTKKTNQKLSLTNFY